MLAWKLFPVLSTFPLIQYDFLQHYTTDHVKVETFLLFFLALFVTLTYSGNSVLTTSRFSSRKYNLILTYFMFEP